MFSNVHRCLVNIIPKKFACLGADEKECGAFFCIVWVMTPIWSVGSSFFGSLGVCVSGFGGES